MDSQNELAHDPRLMRIETWLFDLDNTMYPSSSNLFDQVEQRIGAFIEKALSLKPSDARTLQKQYFHSYGTTLRGLTQNHGTDAREFLDFVHDIDFSKIPADPDLAEAIERLPGRKIIFTNSDVAYSTQVMERIGVMGLFDEIFDIEAAEFLPKPHIRTYRRMLESYDIDAKTAALIDDMPKNLIPAAELGITTVWIRTQHWSELESPSEVAEFDYVVDHLANWLNGIFTV